jgi:hypothetical protein
MATQTNDDASREDRLGEALRILLALAEVDPTVSGATLILPDGQTIYLDAALLRQGGRA